MFFNITTDGIYRVITICGIKFKFCSAKLVYKELEKKLQKKNRELAEKFCKYIPKERYSEYLKDWFYEQTGKILDLDNPKTFNEKIQWLKLYDKNPLKTQLADKYLVRDWVKERIGEEYLIPLLGVWDRFEDIDFDKLPEKFVLKCNHGCGYNIIVTDKSKLDIDEAKQKMRIWMEEEFSFNGLQLHYSGIPRKIIAEEYIDWIANGDNCDYHIFCFNGTPELFYLTNRKGLKDRSWAFYDKDLNLLPLSKGPNFKPAKLNQNEDYKEMFDIAATLCKEFKFVRVDLYLKDGKLYFGEMTFTPSNGTAHYYPSTWELEWGNLLKLD